MEDNLFQSNKDFLDAFKIGSGSNYYDPILLNDTKYGFSIKRNYPENIKYKPAKKNNGKPDDIAVLWVVLYDDKKSTEDKELLTVRIGTYSLWSSNHYEYQENNPDSPSKKSVEYSRGTPKPEALEYNNNFYYDSVNKVFKDKNGTITGEQILDYVFKDHCDTVDPIRGLELRSKYFFRKVVTSFLLAVIWLLKIILERIFQNKLIHKDEYLETMPLSLNMYAFTDIQKDQSEQLSLVGGYKASKSTIIIFCALVSLLSIFSYYKLLDLKYFLHISNDNFLVIVHSIFALALIEIFPRMVLFPCLNRLIKYRAKVSFLSIDPFSYKRWLKPLMYMIIMATLAIFIYFF